MHRKNLLRFDRFLRSYLYGKKGYYAKPVSSKGSDYLTAPQLSPAYCRFLVLYLKKVAAQEFRDKDFSLIDLGSGFGELAEIMLQTFSGHPVTAVEISPRRRKIIAKRIKFNNLRIVPTVSCLDFSIPSALIIANEFFDALPVRIFLREDGLKELFVDRYARTYIFKPVKKINVPTTLLAWIKTIPEGTIFEFESSLPEIATNLSNFRNAVLVVVDYGFKIHEIERFNHGTVVGFSKNRFVNNVLDKIFDGEFLDITHQVNFTFLGEELKKHGWHELFYGTLARFVIENNHLLEKFAVAEERKQILELILGHRFGDSFKVAVYVKKMTEIVDK